MNIKERSTYVRIYTDKMRILQHRIEQSIKIKKESKWNFIDKHGYENNKWYTCINVLKNKEISIIRIKARCTDF